MYKLLVVLGGSFMDNNKNRLKDHPKSNAELRKMYSEAGSEIGLKTVRK